LGTPSAPSRLRVVLGGLGTVGSGVASELRRQSGRFELAAVSSRTRPAERDEVPWVRDPAELLGLQADVFVELTGAREARGWIRAALARGCDVITAHKELVAQDQAALEALAASTGARLRFSAAVGGALPALESVRRAASRGPVRCVEGVLNSTSNLVLTRGEAGSSLEAALAAARKAGLAERDAARDLDGRDAACKLALLAREAFGAQLSPARIPCDAVDAVLLERAQRARERGASVRLVARARRGTHGVSAEVRAIELPDGHPLAAQGIENRLRVDSADGSSELWTAAGAGRHPTGVAVLADLLELARTRATATARPRAVRA